LIIEIGGEKLLLSVTDNNINILKELDDVVLESSELDSQSKFDANVKFGEILKENLLKNKITSKFMKGSNSYESDEFNYKQDKK